MTERRTDLLDFSGQAFASETFASTRDLSHKFIQLFLAQHSFTLTLKHISRMLRDSRLAHHTHGAVTWPSGHGGSSRTHSDRQRFGDIKVLRNAHLDVVVGLFDVSNLWMRV